MKTKMEYIVHVVRPPGKEDMMSRPVMTQEAAFRVAHAAQRNWIDSRVRILERRVLDGVPMSWEKFGTNGATL